MVNIFGDFHQFSEQLDIFLKPVLGSFVEIMVRVIKLITFI
jgi:hypothetical protein